MMSTGTTFSHPTDPKVICFPKDPANRARARAAAALVEHKEQLLNLGCRANTLDEMVYLAAWAKPATVLYQAGDGITFVYEGHLLAGPDPSDPIEVSSGSHAGIPFGTIGGMRPLAVRPGSAGDELVDLFRAAVDAVPETEVIDQADQIEAGMTVLFDHPSSLGPEGRGCIFEVTSVHGKIAQGVLATPPWVKATSGPSVFNTGDLVRSGGKLAGQAADQQTDYWTSYLAGTDTGTDSGS